VPGCGPYTAAMVSSLCFGGNEPALDGNVLRVLSRFLGFKEVWTPKGQQFLKDYLRTQYAQASFTPKGALNEALIELGALVCTKNSPPACYNCPLASSCYAYQQGSLNHFPPLKPKSVTQALDLVALVWTDPTHHSVVLGQRSQSVLLKKTYGFPFMPKSEQPKVEEFLKSHHIKFEDGLGSFTHKITKYDLKVSLLIIQDENIRHFAYFNELFSCLEGFDVHFPSLDLGSTSFDKKVDQAFKIQEAERLFEI
jgi:A/G-specific adenine glycosylase